MPSCPTAWISEAADELGEIISPLGPENQEAIVASPSDTAQVATVLSFAKKRKLTVNPAGGGTKQQWGRGGVPQIYLSLARLNRVIEHPWQDLTCSVQAGCIWTNLQRVLAIQGQFVALDPLFPERATVGGILAANDSGALRHRYGSLRDLVIGMTLVLADGTIVRAGGKVVKNVAGYDLPKLLTGSLGTLAVITQANFRLHSLPRYTQVFMVAAPHVLRFQALLNEIRASHLITQALYVSVSEQQTQLTIALDAHPEAHQDAILRDMIQREGLVLEEASADGWAVLREALFVPEATVLRISTLPIQVCQFLDYLQRTNQRIDIRSVSLAIGLHWVAMRGSAEKIRELVCELRSNRDYRGLRVSVLQAGSGVEIEAFDLPDSTLHVMRAIKAQFDADNILSPGKYFS